MDTRTLVLAAALASTQLFAADVAVDVGHTLEKPGVITERGVTEFELNRRLAADLAQALVDHGISVKLINAAGDTDSLPERTTLAAQDSLFVSIHHDSTQARFRPVSHPRFRGYSLWVSDQRANLQPSLRCAQALGDQLLAGGFSPSHYHAHRVWGESRRMLDQRRGIFANPRLAVLRTAQSPAVLVEAGVVAHPDEEAWLQKSEVHAALVAALASGIKDCVALIGSAPGIRPVPAAP